MPGKGNEMKRIELFCIAMALYSAVKQGQSKIRQGYGEVMLSTVLYAKA